jgi:two-component system, NtrC family, sensor kinase
MNPDDLFRRYQELQQYVGWTDDDARRVQSLATLLDADLPPLIDDFYEEIDRHPDARKVITDGPAQVARLKGTLLQWIRELLSGPYDAAYVARRWQVGWRHVDIGLDQVYTNVALSRLRRGLMPVLDGRWQGTLADQLAVRFSLNILIDLDLAIIEDAYQSEYLLRQQRTERLAAIGQVAGGVAHELRNPLNVVKTSIYYLRNARNPTPEKRGEHMERIERHVVLADGVITALSNFAKQPLPNLRPVPLEACVREAMEMSDLPERITTTLGIPKETPPALADGDQLRIVLANLLRNARDAMPTGGQLTIRARADGEHVNIDVTDSGVGISPENLPRIMEPLYSTKARGLGLGLAIARALVEKNQGSLRVTSNPGRGSTFTVRLRAAVQESDHASVRRED